MKTRPCIWTNPQVPPKGSSDLLKKPPEPLIPHVLHRSFAMKISAMCQVSRSSSQKDTWKKPSSHGIQHPQSGRRLNPLLVQCETKKKSLRYWGPSRRIMRSPHLTLPYTRVPYTAHKHRRGKIVDENLEYTAFIRGSGAWVLLLGIGHDGCRNNDKWRNRHLPISLGPTEPAIRQWPNTVFLESSPCLGVRHDSHFEMRL